MKRITFALAAALILAAFAISLSKLKSDVQANPVASPAAPQLGSKACKNVKFKFTNNRSDHATISIQKVSYRAFSKDHTELVHTSNDCAYGHTCTTTGDNLPDADDRDVTSIQLHYKYKSTAVGSNWSDLVHTPNQPNVASPNCYDGKTYGDGSKGFYIPPQ